MNYCRASRYTQDRMFVCCLKQGHTGEHVFVTPLTAQRIALYHQQSSSQEEVPAVSDGIHSDPDNRVQIGPFDV